MDLFENTVLCKDCGKKMRRAFVEKDGFRIRALQCPSCSNKILHPSDVEEYNKFNSLKNRQFHVKLRLVGNSYTVSIPREIVNFMQEAEQEMNSMRRKMHEEMQRMVTLAMEDSNRIALSFNNGADEGNVPEKKKTIRIIKMRRQNGG